LRIFAGSIPFPLPLNSSTTCNRGEFALLDQHTAFISGKSLRGISPPFFFSWVVRRTSPNRNDIRHATSERKNVRIVVGLWRTTRLAVPSSACAARTECLLPFPEIGKSYCHPSSVISSFVLLKNLNFLSFSRLRCRGTEGFEFLRLAVERFALTSGDPLLM